MRITAATIVVVSLLSVTSALVAQETKPVPKDSVRVFIPGCSKGYVFTVGRRTTDQPGSVDIPEGVHLRMNGPKNMLSAIKAHEGSMIEISGLMKKDEFGPDGISLGGGVRLGPGPAGGGNSSRGSIGNQIMIDVEGWRQIAGNCPAK